MRAQAIVFTGEGEVELRGVTIPEPGPGEVLVETVYSSVSPGTELRCLAGGQPGQPPWPYIAGYALTGHVLRRGEGVDVAEGTPVCAAGTRGQYALTMLKLAGYTNVRNMSGGFNAWKAAGYPIAE